MVGVLGVALGVTSFSCGSDDAVTANNSSGGTQNVGGTGGASARGGGGSFGISAKLLGAACATEEECGSEGLHCKRTTDMVFDGGGAPKGVCTTECAQQGTCQAIASSAVCVDFAGSGYCLEGCTLADGGAQPKCHSRPEFACTQLDTDSLNLAACQPSCRGDHDCSAPTFCDPNSGTCVSKNPMGRNFADDCDANATSDQCRGFCQKHPDMSHASCGELCSFGYPCNWNSSDPGGACVLGSSSIATIGIGDSGFCAQTCNCNVDCKSAGFSCVAFSADLVASFHAKGYCFEGVATDSIITDCEAAGGVGGLADGGSAGAPDGGAGGAL